VIERERERKRQEIREDVEHWQTNDPQDEDLVCYHATKLNISRAFNLRA